MDEKLEVTDAQSAIVFHTNIVGYGYRAPLGTLDIYLNGGNRQIGSSINPIYPDSHRYAYEYYLRIIHYNQKINGFCCANLNDLDTGCSLHGTTPIECENVYVASNEASK